MDKESKAIFYMAGIFAAALLLIISIYDLVDAGLFVGFQYLPKDRIIGMILFAIMFTCISIYGRKITLPKK